MTITHPKMPYALHDTKAAEDALYDLEKLLEPPSYQARPQNPHRHKSYPEAALALLSRRDGRDQSTSEPEQRLSRTAYLDGLRGFAALLVYSLHHQVWVSQQLISCVERTTSTC